MDDEFESDEIRGWASTFFVMDEDERSATELYGIFRRAANDVDLGARGIFDLVNNYDSESDHIPGEPGGGSVIGDLSRVAISGLGGEQDTLYAAPTTDGYIVYAVLPNGGGGVSTPGPDGLVIHSAGDRSSFAVHGLVADMIATVDLIVKGETRPARMGENGFGLRIDDAPHGSLDGLVLHRTDGSSWDLDMRLPREEA